ncbi:hypothetical protein ACFU93_32125 [Streptomyces sp. NPDC057611]|uniref:hypothetical protein n=1 Tax=Streptomyces sp. NPDC057611 TaxID=3346182 RepID=UPI00367E2332
MEHDFPASKALWSQYRCGSSLIPEALLEAVVTRYVREPALRARLLGEGRGLLRAAQRAAEERTSGELVVRPQDMDAVAEAFLRLDEARLRQIDAMHKIAASEQRCQQLQNMVSALQDRCVRLEADRDRAREEARAELQDELALALEYRRQADEQLEHARRARDEAYTLRLAAEAQVTQEQIHVGQQIEQLHPAPHGSAQPEARHPWFPPLDQVAQALQMAREQLDEQDRGLDALRQQIENGEPGSTDLPSLGHEAEDFPASEDVHEPGLDNADNAVTSHSAPATKGSDTGTGLVPAGLAQAVTAAGENASTRELARQLRALHARAGVVQWPPQRLAEAAFPGPPGATGPSFTERAVMTWLAGDSLPSDWIYLKRLICALGAGPEEVGAFLVAYARVIHHTEVDSSPALPPSSGHGPERDVRTRPRLSRWIRFLSPPDRDDRP